MRLGILTLRPWVCLRPLSRNRMSGIEHTSLRPLVAGRCLSDQHSGNRAGLPSTTTILSGAPLLWQSHRNPTSEAPPSVACE
jgi:hypothetical protein